MQKRSLFTCSERSREFVHFSQWMSKWRTWCLNSMLNTMLPQSVFHVPIINNNFTENRRKTRHHCHVTGKFITAVGQMCILQSKYRKSNQHFFVPCFFRNNGAYDSPLLIDQTLRDSRAATKNTKVKALKQQALVQYSRGPNRQSSDPDLRASEPLWHMVHKSIDVSIVPKKLVHHATPPAQHLGAVSSGDSCWFDHGRLYLSRRPYGSMPSNAH